MRKYTKGNTPHASHSSLVICHWRGRVRWGSPRDMREDAKRNSSMNSQLGFDLQKLTLGVKMGNLGMPGGENGMFDISEEMAAVAGGAGGGGEMGAAILGATIRSCSPTRLELSSQGYGSRLTGGLASGDRGLLFRGRLGVGWESGAREFGWVAGNGGRSRGRERFAVRTGSPQASGSG